MNVFIKKMIYMRRIFFILFLLPMNIIFALEGDSNKEAEHYLETYKAQNYVRDFSQIFVNQSDKQDYNRLRGYLNNKKEIERLLRTAADEYYYNLSPSKLYISDYIENIETELNKHRSDDKIHLLVHSVMPNIYYNGEYKVGYIKSDILPAIEGRFKDAMTRDSENRMIYAQLQKNIEVLQQDIFQCEQVIFSLLYPQNKSFASNVWPIITCLAVIGVIILLSLRFFSSGRKRFAQS